MHGKMISAFYHGSLNIFWMSESQRDIYFSRFPFLDNKKSTILSSVFSSDFFETIASLQDNKKNERFLIIGSTSWIKGVEDSIAYCNENNLEHEIVSGVSHKEILKKMSESKGYVFLPRGGDTCPRTVIEAKLLGCKMILNDNVLHKDETWFSTDDVSATVDWLMSGPSRFWAEINRQLSRQPGISGYTTTYNCIDQNYPFEACIESLLGFCDQVVIVDGGSTDGTIDKLRSLSDKNDKILLHIQNRDWSDSRFAVFDGLQKALARAMCTGELCWQQDSDEVVNQNDYDKIKQLVRKIPKGMDLIALPVIEFWGSNGKVRIDSTPWKWRLSRNRPHITHGIPASLRMFDEDGKLYALEGTDGCDYIRSDTYDPIPFTSFYSQDVHNLRIQALTGDENSISRYTNWFSSTCMSLPPVIHYSWYDLERKIKTYKNYWSKHWQSLYNIAQEDLPENNMFFNKPWIDVTDDEISKLSERLENEMGGWIFHSKVDFSKPTPFIKVSESIHPECIKYWLSK